MFVCVWFLFRCPFFVAFIGMSCLCWQVVFVCRVIESIVSGSSMRQSSESAFYGVFFAPPPIIFCFFFLVKKGAFVGHVEVVARRVYRANIRLAICCRRGRCWQGLISWLACHFRQKPRKWCVNWFAGSSCHKPHLIRDFLLFSQIQICRARTRDLNLSHNSL